MMRMPPTRVDFFALEGGLDLVTPAIAVKPGRVLDSQNYEPEISGGYRRIDGYERFDGRAAPSAANYWVLQVNTFAVVSPGEALLGDTSATTADVLAVTAAGHLVISNKLGTFQVGETLSVAAQPVATVVALSSFNGASEPSDDADWLLLAANQRRALIDTVPGSGPVRGVWVYKDQVYAVRDNAGATASVIFRASAAGWVAVSLGAATRLPGGRCEFVNANFTGSALTQKIYGCDGVNPAFEFDGVTYTPIATGMAEDTPTHVAFHKSALFLSFHGSVQFSAPGDPHAWSVVVGAGEMGCGSEVTGFLVQGGTQAGAALSVFTREHTFTLYGSSSTDFQLAPSVFDIGYSAWTMLMVSNDAYGMTGRGIQALSATQKYGDFEYASVSHMVQPLVNVNRGLEVAANALKDKNQYRVYYSNGYCLTVGLTGNKVSGVLLLYYPNAVASIVTATLSSGREVTYFGSDDGFVYQDNMGTSQDGEPIEAWCRLPFNNIKSPLVRKRVRRATFEVKVASYAQVNVAYDFGYGTLDVAQSQPAADQQLRGAGGFWDGGFWDVLTWDARSISGASISIDGTENNLSLLFRSSRAQDASHTLQGVTLAYTPQRLDRP